MKTKHNVFPLVALPVLPGSEESSSKSGFEWTRSPCPGPGWAPNSSEGSHLILKVAVVAWWEVITLEYKSYVKSASKKVILRHTILDTMQIWAEVYVKVARPERWVLPQWQISQRPRWASRHQQTPPCAPSCAVTWSSGKWKQWCFLR